MQDQTYNHSEFLNSAWLRGFLKSVVPCTVRREGREGWKKRTGMTAWQTEGRGNLEVIWLLNTRFLCKLISYVTMTSHDDVIKWKHFPRYWHFVRGIHRSPVNFPHKGHWREALMLSLVCEWIDDLVNNRETGDLKRHRAHYDVIVM